MRVKTTLDRKRRGGKTRMNTVELRLCKRLSKIQKTGKAPKLLKNKIKIQKDKAALGNKKRHEQIKSGEKEHIPLGGGGKTRE